MRKAWPALFEGFVLVQLEQDEVTKNWICYTPPWSITSKNGTFNLWHKKKKSDQVTRFYWWVTAEPVDALVLPDLFPQVPRMTAVALAKPVGGKVENKNFFQFDKDAKYVAKMIPLSTIDPTFVDLSGGFPGTVEVLH
jgi:hypothetical protein